MYSRWAAILGSLGLLDLGYIDFVLGPRIHGVVPSGPVQSLAAVTTLEPALPTPLASAATLEGETVTTVRPVVPSAAADDVRVGPPGQSWWIVNFPETGQVTLSAAAEQQLAQVAARFASSHDVRVNIVGHADERGEGELNDKLGQYRAQAVLAALLNAGFRPDQVRIVSRGEAAPAVLGSNVEAWAANRRAEIEVVTVPRAAKGDSSE